MINRSIVSVSLASALAAGHLTAQSGPSVLDLQASYHTGVYVGEVDSPGGQVTLLSQDGTLDLTSAGAFQAVLNTYEWTAAGPSPFHLDIFGGDYRVGVDGAITLDLDPLNPGTEQVQFLIDPTGEVIHGTRTAPSEDAFSFFAVRKSSGQTNAALSGAYHFYEQYMEFSGGHLVTRSSWGVVTLDGAGNASFVGNELNVGPNGGSSTAAFSGAGLVYSVAPDGAVVFDGSPGGMTQNGEMFFFSTGSTTSSEVGMTVCVKVGANYDHHDLVGAYGLHGAEYELGPTAGYVEGVTDLGFLELTPTGVTAGTWAYDGEVIVCDPFGVSSSPFITSGATSLTNTGVLTLSDPTDDIELAFSPSGRFAAGRFVADVTSLLFAMAMCPANSHFGSGTAGTGGIEPGIGMRTFPVLGNSGFQLAITDALGGAPAILPIGFAPAPQGIPLSGGLLWLDPLQIATAPFLTLGGLPGQPGAGSIDLPLPVPGHPSFTGLELFTQALVLDPQAPSSVAMSQGLAFTFCR